MHTMLQNYVVCMLCQTQFSQFCISKTFAKSKTFWDIIKQIYCIDMATLEIYINVYIKYVMFMNVYTFTIGLHFTRLSQLKTLS